MTDDIDTINAAITAITAGIYGDDHPYSKVLTEARKALDVVVVEVERLRDEAVLLRMGRDATREYADRVEAEVAYLRGERAAVVAYVRSEANQPHPIEAGERALSPSGRGLLLFYAGQIERGEHRREEEP